MASKYWIKLYHEILDDDKMGMLSDRAWRRCIEMFLMAGEKDEDGYLPSTKKIAWRLRANINELEEDLAELQEVGIIEPSADRWIVSHFASRQEAVSPTERTRQFRERQRKNQFKGKGLNGHTGNDGSDDDIAIRKRNVLSGETKGETIRFIESDTDTDTDTNKDRENHAPAPDEERQRECRNAMLSICYGIDTVAKSTDYQQKQVVEAFSELDRLFQPLPDEFKAFSVWWWGDTLPNPKQVLNEWSKFKNQPKRKERNYASNKPGIVGLQDQPKAPRPPRQVYDPATGQTYAQ